LGEPFGGGSLNKLPVGSTWLKYAMAEATTIHLSITYKGDPLEVDEKPTIGKPNTHDEDLSSE